jgi:transaldolase
VKIYLDTADIYKVQSLRATGLIDGVTTNPSHLARCGESPRVRVQELCAMVPDGFMSVEVTEKESSAIYKQAQEIAKLASNILVKIPCHADYYAVIRRLVCDGIRLNITLVFSISQALFMSKLNVHTISPFVGRLDDAGFDGLGTLAEICAMRDLYGFKTEILAASLRNNDHVEGAIQSGADAMTLPPVLFESLVQHLLTDKGMARFDEDWRALGSDITFP